MKRHAFSRWLKLSIVFILSISLLAFRHVEKQSLEHDFAVLILNFTRGIQWPDTRAGEPFTIGVYGYAPLLAELNEMAAGMRGDKKFVIKEITDLKDVSSCKIVFVPAYKARILPEVVQASVQKPVLIITNKTDLARKGSGVNFLLVEGRLRYEINCKSIEARGMKIAATIKGMGIVVN